MICLTITEKTTGEALEVLKTLPDQVDLVEFRLDLMRDPDVERLLRSSPKPAIVTVRRADEGGAFEGSEEDRIALLIRAKRFSAYVDVEWRTSSHYRKRVLSADGPAKVILSFHDFQKTPPDLFTLVRTLFQEKSDLIKIATQACDLEDNFRIFRLLKHARGGLLAHAMGELGYISRILSLKFGSPWTYCHRPGAPRAAPGQIDLDTLVQVYHPHRIRADTAVYALIGNPVAHSLSPHMQNAAFRYHGINAVYVPIRVADLPSLFAFFREMDVRGCSVTIPHKVPILDFLDTLDELAQRMGAVNTVIVDGDRLQGTNTDGIGALRAIQAGGVHLTGSNVLILGAGGSARAVGFVLSSARRLRSLTFVARRKEQARILIQELAPYTSVPLFVSSFDAEELERAFRDVDVVINCTPVGMYPHEDEIPIPPALLKDRPIVFDIVYRPLMTRLLREAQARGCQILTGLDMLVHQGAAQFEAWIGRRAPISIMKAAALRGLQGAFPSE